MVINISGLQQNGRQELEEYLAECVIYPTARALHFIDAEAGKGRDVLNDNVIRSVISESPAVLTDVQLTNCLLNEENVEKLSSEMMEQSLANTLSEYWKRREKEFSERIINKFHRYELEKQLSTVLARRDFEQRYALSVANMDEEDRRVLAYRMGKHIDRHRELQKNGVGLESREWIKVDQDFHAEIFLMLDLPVMIPIFVQLHEEVHRVLVEPRKNRFGQRSQEELIEEHEAIVVAIESGIEQEITNAYARHLAISGLTHSNLQMGVR